MSQLFDNEQFITDKIRAVAQKNNVVIMSLEVMDPNKYDTTKSILLETYDLTVDFIRALEDQFQTKINMIFATNNFTTQIFVARSSILRLLD